GGRRARAGRGRRRARAGRGRRRARAGRGRRRDRAGRGRRRDRAGRGRDAAALDAGDDATALDSEIPTDSALLDASVDAPGEMPQILTVTLTGGGSGVVTSTPSGLDCGTICEAGYLPGQIVALQVSPDSLDRFVGWSGACSGMGPCTLVMDEAR